jgi:uncharacterized DUF497 family protein
MILPVEFEWDDDKAEANLEKHGIAFSFAVRVFSDPFSTTVADLRKDYGEPRWIVHGVVENILLVVVYTLREQKFRLISARRANDRERKTFKNSQIRLRP